MHPRAPHIGQPKSVQTWYEYGKIRRVLTQNCSKNIDMNLAEKNSKHARFYENNQSDTLLIAFAGNAGLYGGMPTFEFHNIMEDIPVNKLFLRDPHKMWYQNGVPGIGETIDEIADWLRFFASYHHIERIVTVGNSGGGYAALVFGILLQVSEVHAFVPQARLIDPEDSHRSERIRKIQSDPGCICQHLDIRKLILKTKSIKRPKINIYYCTNDLIDVQHVNRIKDIKNINVFGFNHGGHDVIKILKDKGILENLLQSSLLNNNSGSPVTESTVRKINTWHLLSVPFRAIEKKYAKYLRY